MHSGFSVGLDRPTLRRHFDRVGALFANFAQQLPDFSCLSPRDQRTLVGCNSSMFCQYILGRYFHASTGLEQVQWMLLGRNPPALNSLLGSQQLNFLSLWQFNQLLPLYTDHTALSIYEEYSRRLSRQHILQDCTFFVALACLFSSNLNSRMEDPVAVHRNLGRVYAAADWAHRHLSSTLSQADLKMMVLNLEAMANSFGSQVDWNDQQRMANQQQTHLQALAEPATSLVPVYSEGEENFLQQQLSRYRDSFAAVPFGEGIIREYLMYNLDVPFSKDFMPSISRIWAERFRHVMKSHPEFRRLRDSDQASLWVSSTFDAVALTIVKQVSTCA